jgi:5-methylcytosine-specific restriction protein B
VTFHQGYSYEDFIIGKRPKPFDGGIVLEPHFGVLMSIAIRISQEADIDGYLLIIDEINRANASQVFGEFITLLDPDYRATIEGTPNTKALKIRLPGIAYKDGLSEKITMLREGGTFQLPEDWVFPEHLYVLATMNSVDKAALPLDSALTRRFHRITMTPDLDLLAKELGVDLAKLPTKARSIREGSESIDTLTAEETTVLLLDRLNVFIATDIGEDFELGQTLVWSVVGAKPEARWAKLINAWDHVLLPQLMERYAGRDDSLRELLKVAPESKTVEAFCDRVPMGGDTFVEAPLKLNPFSSLTQSTAISILRELAI